MMRELSPAPAGPVEHIVFRHGKPTVELGRVTDRSWYGARQQARTRWGDPIDCLTPDLYATMIEYWRQAQADKRALELAQRETTMAKATNGKARKT